ncbi:MAG TPA: ERAP1-like C-terminal domain-containing protein, partial [Thermoplasmata archaeon]|nr:ERAP1-like C-terminal domain-containing protein [Thermoplasmata archaeon]
TSGPSDEAAEDAAFAMEGLPTERDAAEVLRRATAEPIRTTHLGYLVWSVAENPVGRDHAWTWLQANVREFERKSEGSWMLSNLLRRTIPCVGLDRPAEVREYFRRESFPEGSTGVRRGLEMLEVYRSLRERSHASIVAPPVTR